MATWADFHPELFPQVLGCSIPLADQALREAAREFMARTRIWREWLDPAGVTGRLDYELEAPTGAMVVRIEQATSNGNPIAVISSNEAPSNEMEFAQREGGVISRDRVTFTLARQLPAGTRVAIEASLMPSKKATGLPDHLYFQHSAAIVNGAKHRLMLTPQTTFFQPDIAMAAKAAFDQAIDRAAVAAWRGNTGTTPRHRVNWC